MEWGRTELVAAAVAVFAVWAVVLVLWLLSLWFLVRVFERLFLGARVRVAKPKKHRPVSPKENPQVSVQLPPIGIDRPCALADADATAYGPTVGVVAEPPAGAASSPTVVEELGYRVATMLGTVVFGNSLKAGKFGDWLTAQYYTTRPTRPYVKLKSKLPGEKGIDGVYRRYCLAPNTTRYTNTYELLVVENKINSGKLRAGQLSVEWVRSRCKTMMQSGDRELQQTAAAIINALDPETEHSVLRLLVTHDLVQGVSQRHYVDDEGRKGQQHGKWRNHRRITKSLSRKLEKGEIRLDKRA